MLKVTTVQIGVLNGASTMALEYRVKIWDLPPRDLSLLTTTMCLFVYYFFFKNIFYALVMFV